MHVELVAHNPLDAASGIGYYTRELHRHLSSQIPIRIVRPISPPLADRFTCLHQLPLGLRGHQPGSIVHFTQIMGCSQMLWRPVRPAIASVHDLGVLVCPEDEQLFNRFDRWVLDVQFAGLRRMDHFLVHSEFTRDGLTKQLGIAAERISVLPIWIDSTRFRPVPDSRRLLAGRYGTDFDDGSAYLAYVGSELPRKNLNLLLAAMAILKGSGHRVKLIKIGGAGGERWRAKFKQDVDRLGLSGEIVLTGVVSEEDLVLLINAADVCVTPTLLESTFAWVALTAMACGRPAVATASALIPTEAEEAVIVVPDRDAQALARAIETFLEDRDLARRMGDAGRRIIRGFRGELTARAIVDAYRRLLGSPT